jgi:hypothetical protein
MSRVPFVFMTRFVAAAVLLVLVLGSLGCSAPAGVAELTITPDQRELSNDGSSVRVRVTAIGADGKVGAGTVQLTTDVGEIDPSSGPLDAYGTLFANFTCDVARDAACLERATLTARWNGVEGLSTITLKSAPIAPTFTATNCNRVSSLRPPSTGTTSAPRVGSVSSKSISAGSAVPGSVPFADDQNDEQTALIQFSDEPSAHYTCALTSAELAAKSFTLSRLSFTSAAKARTTLVYVGIRDAAGNVSGYSSFLLSVGSTGVLNVCPSAGTAAAVQLTGSAPSASTEFYTGANGRLQSYALGSQNGEKLTIVYRSVTSIDMGSCTRLLVSADAAGRAAAGWDNCLVAEIRAAGVLSGRAAWCNDATLVQLFDTTSGERLTQPLEPSIPGTQLNPSVPNAEPFGFPAQAIDLMSLVPSGTSQFELSLYVLDYGVVGSTTEIWAQPR